MDNAVLTTEQQTEKAILAKLAELGGQRITDDDIIFEGRKIILPETMNLEGAIQFLHKKQDQDEEYTTFRRVFRYRPWDGAHAFQAAVKQIAGMFVGKAIHTFFGTILPSMVSIDTGVGMTEQVPWGQVAIPLFEGTISLGGAQDAEWGPLFSVTVETKCKHRVHVEGLFRAIEEELRTNSIYKGKAITGKTEAEFLDLRGVDPHKVVYSEDLTTQLDANVWSLLEHTSTMREMGLPLKRSVLLEGPYGTGKTLAAFLTAQVATENGWTFIYCRPAKDDLDIVMSTARLYQPAVIFFEDVDTIASGEEADSVTQLLDMFDGITAKGTELMVILTTNHPERIHKGMIRPGRLDAVLHVGALDALGIERMVKATVPPSLLQDDVDFDLISKAMDGFLPAFVKEAIDRAMRYAIARHEGQPPALVTDDFVQAAAGLRPQLDLMEEAREGGKADGVGAAIRRVVRASMDQAELVRTEDNQTFGRVSVNGD